jgi:NADPH2:quinone reductase
MPLPETISFEEGASIPVAYGTSYHALVDKAGLAAGEALLVLGAGGGVGISAVQIGKALGATVIAAVSSEEKADAVRAAGADSVIRYDQVPLRDGIAAAAGGGGVDVVYDPVGGESTELALRSTNWNGRLLVVGFASGVIPSIPLNLNLVKGNSVIGVFWGRFIIEEPDKSAENNRRIMEWVGDGTLRPLVQKAYPLEDAVEAMRWVAERRAVGRVVVTP